MVSRLSDPFTSIKRALVRPPLPDRKHWPSPPLAVTVGCDQKKENSSVRSHRLGSLRVGFCWLHPSGVHFLASNQLGDPEGVRGNSLSSHDALCCKYLIGRGPSRGNSGDASQIETLVAVRQDDSCLPFGGWFVDPKVDRQVDCSAGWKKTQATRGENSRMTLHNVHRRHRQCQDQDCYPQPWFEMGGELKWELPTMRRAVTGWRLQRSWFQIWKLIFK